MKRLAAVLAGLLAASAQMVRAEVPPRIPLIGLDGPEKDGCAAVGRVTGLDPGGDYFLAVHVAPEADSREVDRLGPAVLVWLCEAAGSWQGIVYAAKGADFGDCRVSNPVSRPEPYSGPCRTGWVDAHYIQLIAG